MTHDQIVAALRRGYQLDDAQESRRGCYPIRKSAPRATARRMPPPTRPGSATAASSEAMTGRGQTHGERAAHAIVAPVDTVDHARGDPLGPVIVEYGDYECPYARVAFREIERVQRRTGT
jgi:protein-disulfide isomerase